MAGHYVPWLIVWSVTNLFLAIDVVWLSYSRLVFAPSNITNFVASLGLLGAMAVIAIVIEWRVRNDQAPIARIIARATQSLRLFLLTGAALIALGAVGVTFSYLTTSTADALQDANLAAFDRALGFDWPSFLAWTNTMPNFVFALRAAYHTTGPQLILIPVMLAITLKRDRLAEFMAVFAVSSLLTGVTMTLVPAEGAFAYFKPDPATFSHYSPISGMWHHATLVELRQAAAPVLDFTKATGLVTFPSFHTVLAILTCYAVRDWRWLLGPVVALNTVVLIGTVTEGGHHLVDLLAGAAVVCVSIVFVRWLSRPAFAGVWRTKVNVSTVHHQMNDICGRDDGAV